MCRRSMYLHCFYLFVLPHICTCFAIFWYSCIILFIYRFRRFDACSCLLPYCWVFPMLILPEDRICPRVVFFNWNCSLGRYSNASSSRKTTFINSLLSIKVFLLFESMLLKVFLFYLVLPKITISEMCHKSLQLFTMLWILNNSFNLSINVLCDFMMRSFTDSELIIPVFYTVLQWLSRMIKLHSRSSFILCLQPNVPTRSELLHLCILPAIISISYSVQEFSITCLQWLLVKRTKNLIEMRTNEKTARKSTTSAPLAVSARSSATFIIREELLSDIHVLPQYTVIGGALFICWDGLCALRMRGNMRGSASSWQVRSEHASGQQCSYQFRRGASIDYSGLYSSLLV